MFHDGGYKAEVSIECRSEPLNHLRMRKGLFCISPEMALLVLLSGTAPAAVVPLKLQESFVQSDYPITGKHFPSSGVSGTGAELGIDSSVLDILMAQPVLGEVNVFAGVQYVSADRVLEGVELLLLRGKSGGTAVLLHQHQQGAAVNWEHSVGYKQVGGSVLPAFDVGANEFHGIRRHRVGTGH